eukprot:3658818-Heterocapsa_arctica.AAC.1
MPRASRAPVLRRVFAVPCPASRWVRWASWQQASGRCGASALPVQHGHGPQQDSPSSSRRTTWPA